MMAQIISATARLNGAGRQAPGELKRDRFLRQASELIASARGFAAEKRWDRALELAYQAGLRTAGARVAVSPVAKRRRLPSSAWEQLSLVSAADKAWAAEFSRYSRIRSRVASGLEDAPSSETVFAVLELAARFLDATVSDGEFDDLAA
ncbi:SAV_6107 family HEPN domain-containing protein [Corynebacterium flavescens]|uniref:SAV_6107 family HEPN domain-containing protein n=1 Tax=Corynebacterium flavescens TaxID=28028 RepID=UPI00289C74EB|nr:SAV_6107 family HEPN domain-containing protein [Corynebacterium flavescens]